jgi:hypothetical protein
MASLTTRLDALEVEYFIPVYSSFIDAMIGIAGWANKQCTEQQQEALHKFFMAPHELTDEERAIVDALQPPHDLEEQYHQSMQILGAMRFPLSPALRRALNQRQREH